MSKILCIFPAERNTEFLRPFYKELLNKNDMYGLECSSTEDDYYEILEREADEAEMVIFLGHGSSHTLYGDNNNTLFDAKYIKPLYNKKLLLFACKSAEFAKNNKLTNSIGFGFIPSSEEDFQNGKLHNLKIDKLDTLDVDILRASISDILVKTLRECNFLNLNDFQRCFSFQCNCEIVKYLTKRKYEVKNYRLLADVIYYIENDMELK